MTSFSALVGRLTAVAAFSLLAASCGDGGSTTDPLVAGGGAESPGAPDPWGPLAVVEAGDGAGEALIVGELQIGDECVLLDERGEPALLLWPSERTVWDSAARTVSFVTDDGDRIVLHDGDTVTFGGGGTSISEGGASIEEFLTSVDWVAEPAPECVAGTRWSIGDLVDISTRPSDDEPTDDEIEPIAYRLLGEDLAVGEPFSTMVVASESEFHPVRAESGLDSGMKVDFTTEVVFVFDFAESSTPDCAITAMSGLVYDEPHQRIYPVTGLVGQTEPDEPVECDGDANPHRVIVAVARTDLPEGGFSLWIDAGDPAACCEDGVTFVAAGELTTAQADFPALAADGALDVGETRIAYDVTTHCGVEFLFRTIADTQWKATDLSVGGIDPIPDTWGATTQGSQSIDLIIERVHDDQLLVTAVGTTETITYAAVSEAVGCD